MRGRTVGLLAVTLPAVTACSSPAGTSDRQSDPPPEGLEHIELPQVAAGPREDGPSALDNMRDERLPRRSAVGRTGVLEVDVDGKDVIVWHRPGQASALGGERIVRGRDVGTVAVFGPVVNGRRLQFAATGSGFLNRETGSQWNVLGQATIGPLKGQRLAPHQHLDTFWFAWVAFQPETRVIG